MMEVDLLVYDLSGGLARQMSQNLLGIQIDAIYHTSVQLHGREYVYDGGIIAIAPGSSHLGQPLQKLSLGRTNLSMDLIEGYLDSVRPIYTPEAYDLFRHNCNNFTDAFSHFLVGSGIPKHIVDMPRAVLETPFGRMLFPHLDQSVNAHRANGSILGLEASADTPPKCSPASTAAVPARLVEDRDQVAEILNDTKHPCAVLFFDSFNSPSQLHAEFDHLASELNRRATFAKVNTNLQESSPLATHLSVRSLPTFITFLNGREENRWTSADAGEMARNIRDAVRKAYPPHPHDQLRLPTFSKVNREPILYPKPPPFDKVSAKLGNQWWTNPGVDSLAHFIETTSISGPQNAFLPDLKQLAVTVTNAIAQLPKNLLFAMVDLFRCSLVDPRISAFFAEEAEHATIKHILQAVNEAQDAPHTLRLVTLQMACNIFSSPLFDTEALRDSCLAAALAQLVSSSLLRDDHENTRIAAASLLSNVAYANRLARDECRKDIPGLFDDDQVEIAASILEAISQEEKSAQALRSMLVALGNLTYRAELDGGLADLLRVMDARRVILAKRQEFPEEPAILEVAEVLLGKDFLGDEAS